MMLNPSEIACKRQINKLRYTSCDLELGNLAKLIILKKQVWEEDDEISYTCT